MREGRLIDGAEYLPASISSTKKAFCVDESSLKLISSSKMAFREDERAIVAVWSSNMALFEDKPGHGVGLAWENMCETPHFCTYFGEKRGNMCGMGVFTHFRPGDSGSSPE